jgi:hypothetical protein
MRARAGSLRTPRRRPARDWRSWARDLKNRRLRRPGTARYAAMLLLMPAAREMARRAVVSTVRIDLRPNLRSQYGTTRTIATASTVHVFEPASVASSLRRFSGRNDAVPLRRDIHNLTQTSLQASDSHRIGFSPSRLLPARRSRIEGPSPRPVVAKPVLQQAANAAIRGQPPAGTPHAERAVALKWRRTELPGALPHLNVQRLVRQAPESRERARVARSDPAELTGRPRAAIDFPQGFAGANPALSPQWVSDLTTKVVREIDRRVVAYRERMGTVF